jgi:hypothetical protein
LLAADRAALDGGAAAKAMEAAKSATVPHTVLTALVMGLCKRLICVLRPYCRFVLAMGPHPYGLLVQKG